MSRVISSDGAFKAWAQPSLDAPKPQPQPQQNSESEADREKERERERAALREQARREGFEQGLAEGRAKAHEELILQAGHLEALLNALAVPLQYLDVEVEDELVKLAVATAKQIVRRELKSDPAQVVGVVKEALGALPMASQSIKIHLHPDDARLVTELMLANVTERRWEVVENPVMQRGGCRIETDTASVDATIESRVAAIAARIMGGERSNDG